MKALLPFAAASALLLAGCALVTGTPGSDANADGPLVVRVPHAGAFSWEVDTGSDERDVFFVFTASADRTSWEQATVDRLSVDGKTLPAPGAPKLPAEFGPGASAAQRIADFNRTALSRLGAAGGVRAATLPPGGIEPRFFTGSVGDAGTFSEDEYVVAGFGAAHVRAVAGPFDVEADGVQRTLVVWVSDDEWEGGGGPVTQEMVDALVERFLKDGADNDIYDWLTAILGPEWGATGDPDLVGHTGDIHILLTDIEGDGSDDGGIVGFFYALNNFRNPTGVYDADPPYAELVSNEKIMFVIDSVMYANPAEADGTPDATWEPDDYWPQDVFSTLAHEFQHMIHFYQKAVVAGAGETADVWIDEMCAQLAEDLLADKMGVPGPRGVAASAVPDGSSGPADNEYGRIPIYNQYTYLPLAVIGGFDLLDYSTAYAFGAWAARSYGGSEFLRRIVRSPYTDRTAVERAAETGGAERSDLDALIARWAVSVMGSDRTDMPRGYRLNSGGWFASSSGGTSYNLGSIDFHKYLPFDPYAAEFGTVAGPRYLEADGGVPNLYASSNVYYAAARGLKGKKSFEISLPAGVAMHVVVR